MASQRAKELAAKQKAEMKAAKLAKKNSDNPRDWGTIRQIREAYRVTKEQEPRLPWYMLGVFVLGVAVFTGLGFVLGSPILWGVLGISVGVLAALFLLTRLARRSMYRRYEGQVGSAEVALGMLGRKWNYNVGIAAARNRDSVDVVHRVLGPGGLILIGEGNAKNLKKLLASEKRRHEQVAFGVDVDVIQMGKGAGQVPLDALANDIKKRPKKLTTDQIAEVKSRLKALDAMRPAAPIPKGPINAKGARQAMRGR